MKNTIKIELIENFINAKHLTKSKFCKMCKISLSTLNKILANGENFRIIALFKIAKVLNIHIYQLFN